MVDNFSNIKERIMQIAKNQNISYESFFEKIGVSYGNFKGDNKKRPINSNVLENILTIYPNVNPEWLLTGKGEILKTKSEENVVKKNDHINDHINDHKPNVKKMWSNDEILSASEPQSDYGNLIRKIKFAEGVNIADEGSPFYPLPVSFGTVAELVDYEEKPTGYISMPGITCKAFFPAIGFSFKGIINPGDIVGIDFINQWETLDPDRLYLIITHDQRMAKRLVADPNDSNKLICISPNFPDFKISKSDIIVIHKIVFCGRPV